MGRMRVTARFGSRKRLYSFEINPEADLRTQVKKACRLQIPIRVLGITYGGVQYNHESPQQFLRHIQHECELHASLLPPFTVGNYEISGTELGSGSFSQVYLGKHKVTKENVAIKVVDTKQLTSEKTKEYHEREKKIISTLNHPNIVALRDMLWDEEKDDGKYYYFVTEVCSGGSLESLVDRKPLSEPQAKRFLNQIVEAFRYLSGKGIVHRDLKPQNILASSKDRDTAILKICDFGFSRYYRSQEDETSLQESMMRSHPSSPQYAPPDLLAHQPYDDRCDVWAVGAIFYEMLSGQPLFNARTMSELHEQQANSAFLEEQLRRLPNVSQQALTLLSSLIKRNDRLHWKALFHHPYLSNPLLRVFCVSTAEEYSVELSEELTVSAIKIGLEEVSSIPAAEQWLVDEKGTELSNDVVLEAGVPHAPLVLFPRSFVVPSPQTVQEKIPKVSTPERVNLRPLSAQDPFFYLLQPLQQIEEHLRQVQKCSDGAALLHTYHHHTFAMLNIYSRGIYWGGRHLLEAQKECQRSLTVLEDALGPKLSQGKADLQNLEKVLEDMAQTPLHPSLRKENRQTLLDCFPSKEIKQKFERFQKVETSLTSSFKDLSQTLENLHSQVLKIGAETFPGPSHRAYLTQARDLKNNIAVLVEVLAKEQNRLSTELKNARQQLAGPSHFTENSRNHENLQVFKDKVSQLLEDFAQVTANTFRAAQLGRRGAELCDQVASVKEEISRVRSSVDRIPVEGGELERLHTSLSQVVGIPSAYEAYLNEMARRNLMATLMKRKVERLTAMFAEERDAEESRLHVFSQQHGKILPVEAFPGVDLLVPPSVDILAPPFPSLENSIGQSSLSAEMLGREFAEICDEGEISSAELRRENKSLREEILALRSNIPSAPPVPLLEEFQRLKDELKRKEISMEKLLEGYEQKMKEMKQKGVKSKETVDLTQSNLSLQAQLRKAEENAIRALEEKRDVEKALQQAREESHSFEQTKADYLATFKLLQKKYKVEGDAKNQLEAQLSHTKTQLHELEELVVELQNKATLAEREVKELRLRQEEQGKSTENWSQERTELMARLEKLKGKVQYGECPFCFEFFPQNLIQQHVAISHP